MPQVIRSLELNVFPEIGKRPIKEIDAAELLNVLRTIEKRGSHEIAGRVLQRCSAVFRYAIATSRIRTNPAADLKGALTAPVRKHYAALSEAELPEFLHKLSNYDGSPVTKLALRLLVLTFVRTGELRQAEWTEFDLKKGEWRIPAERMKGGIEHVVPLSKRALNAQPTLLPLSPYRP